jgi:hypothetical protein
VLACVPSFRSLQAVLQGYAAGSRPAFIYLILLQETASNKQRKYMLDLPPTMGSAHACGIEHLLFTSVGVPAARLTGRWAASGDTRVP